MASTLPLSQPESLDEWVAIIHEEVAAVREWATQEGWGITAVEEEIAEGGFDAYRVPTLEIQTDVGTVHFRPVGRRVLGAAGRFDLVAWPSLYRVMLLRRQPDGSPNVSADPWVVRTESGIDWPEPWNRETFVRLARSLARA